MHRARLTLSPLRIATVIVVLIFCAVDAHPQAADVPHRPPAEPTQIVAWLHESLLATMKQGDSLSYPKRCDQLRPVIEATHDLDFIARSVMREFWKGLQEPQRTAFLDTFRQLSIGTYADKFDHYDGQKFESLEERTLKRGSILVRTRLLRAKKEPVQLDYVLVKRGDRWKIVNVVADGVSDLALKRAEYGSVMRAEGFDGLLEKLRQKLAVLFSDQGT